MRPATHVFPILLIGFSLSLYAQQAPPALTAGGPTAGAGRQVVLDVVVTDHDGNPVPDLRQGDFTIIDNKKEQPIQAFREAGRDQVTDPPLQAVVLIDAVNADFSFVSTEEQLLKGYLLSGNGELPMPMALNFLTDTQQGGTAESQDGKVLVDGLNSNPYGLRTIKRSGGFYGAEERANVSLSGLEKVLTAESSQPGRKLVIWLGPGWPLLTGPRVNLSSKGQQAMFTNIVELSTVMRQARITLYSVSTPGSLSEATYYEGYVKGVTAPDKVQTADLAVQVLAVQSGGRVLNRSNSLSEEIAACATDARVYYTLAFDAPTAAHGNEYHALQIKMNKPGLTARTRTGYYAQP